MGLKLGWCGLDGVPNDSVRPFPSAKQESSLLKYQMVGPVPINTALQGGGVGDGGRGKGGTKFEISALFMIQQQINRRCLSSRSSIFSIPSNRPINSKCNAMSVDNIISKTSFRKTPSSSANNEGHRSWIIRPMVRQWKFSNTERSLKIVAREDPVVARKAFVTPGWAASWPIAATHNARVSMGRR
jgi:hypothetical protein